ncbi:Selenocysteine-specific elongation factor [Bacillus sp. THAF10]|nr:Selenocysteine-specific elongation factor [Bacillus sp. THAF10]
MTKHFTIGMAGHIDHGKTTLTKALTGVETDRLKEEKERGISIELGFAPFLLDHKTQLSIIDVPGHERFIRQMIAGVSGIDLVILVVAADEGVMPQTKEHLAIIKYLQIKNGIIAITKKDLVEEEMLELVEEEIVDELEGTVFQHSPVVFVNSTKNEGIDRLKKLISSQLEDFAQRSIQGPFRLAVDQVFSLKGQGTIVRGTIEEGSISLDQELEVLPERIPVRVRHLQVHNHTVQSASAGQRVAMNLPNVGKDRIARGDVLATPNAYEATDTIDVSVEFMKSLSAPIKQRSSIKIHIGTAEVMGRIVFFDRNEFQENDHQEVLCQIRLDEKITAKRGDRFILRRPSPAETIGGGWVIQPNGSKYRFGEVTIQKLTSIKEGTPEERVQQLFSKRAVVHKEEIFQETGVSLEECQFLIKEEKLVEINNGKYSFIDIISSFEEQVIDYLNHYHERYPMRVGAPKAELLMATMGDESKDLGQYVLRCLIEKKQLEQRESLLHLTPHQPGYPVAWKKRMEQVVGAVEEDKLTPQPFLEHAQKAGLPDLHINELRYFLVSQSMAYELDEKHLIHRNALHEAVRKLKSIYTEKMELNDIKETFSLSRKYLIPFVELLDRLGYTKRIESERYWRE